MRITVFNNKKGLIHGDDPKRIFSEKAGVLCVGKTEITLAADEESLMPMLFYGATGNYEATLRTARGGAL